MNIQDYGIALLLYGAVGCINPRLGFFALGLYGLILLITGHL